MRLSALDHRRLFRGTSTKPLARSLAPAAVHRTYAQTLAHDHLMSGSALTLHHCPQPRLGIIASRDLVPHRGSRGGPCAHLGGFAGRLSAKFANLFNGHGLHPCLAALLTTVLTPRSVERVFRSSRAGIRNVDLACPRLRGQEPRGIHSEFNRPASFSVPSVPYRPVSRLARNPDAAGPRSPTRCCGRKGL